MSISVQAKQFSISAGLQTGSVLIAGALRRTRIPTPAFCAFAVIQAVGSTIILTGVKLIEKRFEFFKKTTPTERKTIERGNYILSQVLSIGLTFLAMQSLSYLGAPLLYDMNSPSLSPFDGGSIYCIVAQSTLVTLFAQAMHNLYTIRNK